jgi:hypothetical protein
MLVRLYLAYPTPPRPTSAVHESGAAHLLSMSPSIVPRSTKPLSRPNGITIDGGGGVSRRSKAGSVSAGSGPLELKAVPQLTRWKMERSVHWAVDVARLEASVRIPISDCRSHTRVYSLDSGVFWCLRPSVSWSAAVLQPGCLRRCPAGSSATNLPRCSDITATYCARAAVCER